MRLEVLALALALAGCVPPPVAGECVSYAYESQFTYEVTPSFTTDGGIAVDPTGQPVDGDAIDRRTAEVEACLAAEFGSPARIPDDVRAAADCLDDSFALPLARACLVVKVPDDWGISCDGAQQVLPARAPGALCLAKGLAPTEACPCRWRAGIQDEHVLVTTPDLHLFKDPLVRLATGCNNPWAHAKLARCAMP